MISLLVRLLPAAVVVVVVGSVLLPAFEKVQTALAGLLNVM